MRSPSVLLLILFILSACHKNDKQEEPGPGNPPDSLKPFIPNNQHVSVTTQHNDNNRAGWNNLETLLNTLNVNAQNFGKLYSLKVDDQVYAQPLIVGDLPMDTVIQTGAMLSVSSNGNTAGSGILWAVFPSNCNAEDNVCPGVLYAFDADNIRHELWNSNAGAETWNFAKFSSPAIANGHVYIATFSGYVNVYGMK